MACFIVPGIEAVVTTVVTNVVASKEKKREPEAKRETNLLDERSTYPFSRKLKWLNCMLWGGTALLFFEHIWHGEVVPWFPFLTAAASPSDTVKMVREMLTTGLAMSASVTLIWIGIVVASKAIEKRSLSITKEGERQVTEK